MRMSARDPHLGQGKTLRPDTLMQTAQSLIQKQLADRAGHTFILLRVSTFTGVVAAFEIDHSVILTLEALYPVSDRILAQLEDLLTICDRTMTTLVFESEAIPAYLIESE